MGEDIGSPLDSKTPRPGSSATVSTAAESAATSSGHSLDVEREEGSDDDDEAVDGPLREYLSATRVEQRNRRAAEENARLNLNLGLAALEPLVSAARRDGAAADGGGAMRALLRPPVQLAMRLLDRLLSFVEGPLYRLWSERVPLRLRQKLTFLAWGLYLPLHKALIGRRSGLHRDVSLEYHALTSVMWWGRLFPITVRRMRYSLGQLHVWHPPDRYPRWTPAATPSSGDASAVLAKPNNGARHGIRGHVHQVYFQMERKRTLTGFRGLAKETSAADMTVTGQYIQHASRPSKKVLFWIYGGAYLAGDSRGNLGIAEKMGMLCGEDGPDGQGVRDVFIPDYRLVPEHHLDDALHDVALAFEYLIYKRGVRPEDVTLCGISSGGGLATMLLQALARSWRERDERGYADGPDATDESSGVPAMPAGAVLIGPFVDYTKPSGTMKEYVKHDLIVNQSVYDVGIPYLETILGGHRLAASPVYGSFAGLPPLCIVVSKHEVVYDQAMLLAERAEEQGVDVTVGVWKYMCHVFPLLCPFIPEGQESFEFMCDWIRAR